jgi:hypothetical protein
LDLDGPFSGYNKIMETLERFFEKARRVEVSSRWYYDIGEHQFEQFKEYAQSQPDLISAIDESLQMTHWYGPSYLVPIDPIHRNSETARIQRSQPNGFLSQEAP